MNRFILIVLFFVANSATAQFVYKTPSGNKYHLSGCRMVNNVSERLTVAEAHKVGLDACLICKPSQTIALGLAKKVQGETVTKQCRGRTKKGSQCRHMTAIGNGFCYQHQPG